MNKWISNICGAAEDELVRYAREAGLKWLNPDQIYAGLSHASHDNPDDLETVTDDATSAEMLTVPGPELNDLPTQDEFVTNPRAVIMCKSWTCAQDDVNALAKTVHCRMEVFTHSDDDRGRNHHEKAGEFFDRFCDPDAATNITESATDFTVFGIYEKGGGYDFDGHNWVSYLEFDMPCAAVNLA